MLAEHIEALSRAGLPLGQGLRAAAQEAAQPRVAAALEDFANALDEGQSLDQILLSRPQLVPQQIGRLIEAGIRSNRLADVLNELLEVDRVSRDLLGRVRSALLYPALLIAGFFCLVVFIGVAVLPDFKDFFQQWELRVPTMTMVVLWFSGSRLLLLVGIIAAAIPLAMLVFRAALSPAQRSRWIARIPILGPLFQWRNLVYWSRLLSLFVEYQIALPDALRLAADGANDKGIAQESRALARAVASGRGMADTIAIDRQLPLSLVPILRWGEQNVALAHALRTSGDMFEHRVKQRVALVEAIMPPMLFIFIAVGVIALLNVMVSPLMDLIHNLSL